jgi:hypothetical protein
MVHEAARDAVSVRDLRDDLTVRRTSGVKHLYLGARLLSPLQEVEPLPGNTRGGCRRSSLFDGMAETNLLQEPELLVLTSDDLDKVVLHAPGKRAGEAE